MKICKRGAELPTIYVMMPTSAVTLIRNLDLHPTVYKILFVNNKIHITYCPGTLVRADPDLQHRSEPFDSLSAPRPLVGPADVARSASWLSSSSRQTPQTRTTPPGTGPYLKYLNSTGTFFAVLWSRANFSRLQLKILVFFGFGSTPKISAETGPDSVEQVLIHHI